jgi:Methyltransferase domain
MLGRSRLKERVPLEWRHRLRRLNRFRWAAKYRALRSFGISPRSEPGVAARFIFLDPELDNFTYELANEHDLPAFVAGITGSSPIEAAAHMFELRTDPVLRAELDRQTRWRLDIKRRPEYGHRLAWYALARWLKPGLIVETGVQDGLGSITLLRALERNSDEGAPGRLMSFDLLPGSGWLVSDRFRANWELVIGSTFDTLPGALAGHSVGMIFHDSLDSYDCEQFEFDVAMKHADDRLILLSNRAAVGGLRDLARVHGLPYSEFHEQPLHFYPGTPQAVALYERPQQSGHARTASGSSSAG